MYSEFIEFRGKIDELSAEGDQFYIVARNEITEGGLKL